ncbi:MAG: glycoside hydrolase family 88 protein, partial [Clostridia bacterium]|nr:glycoside hydrolase family 88 protein [Clostridia bacterium]
MYNRIIEENQAWIDDMFAKIDKKLSQVAVRSRDKIPFKTIDGVHDTHVDENPLGITWWTNGFWGGLMWLMYEATGNEEYLTTAKNAERIMDKAFTQFDLLHHDVGFMWHIMSGASYRLTGDKESRTRALYAASILASRYNMSGGFIRAWNGAHNEGWSIIDCLMNIPLLYWASEETGDSRFRQIAIAHADMAMRHHVRPDGSTAHICSHDVATGELLETFGGQGYVEGSCWTRGLGWGVYGFILSYIHTGKQEYLDTAKNLAHYYIANAAVDDYIPRVDYRSPYGDGKFDAT